jgi:chromosomal replication initiator protein
MDPEARPRFILAAQQATADLFGVALEELRSKSDRGAVRLSRQIAMYLAKQMTNASLGEIGQSFDRDAAFVARAVSKIEKEKTSDILLQGILTKLQNRLTMNWKLQRSSE